MKEIVLLLSLVTASVGAFAQKQYYIDYIEQWKETAILNQEYYGIPASITMAQALLESAAGKSELAINANNHFGIKCNNDWMGGVYYYDDDREGECFRQYADAAESFKDHSLFLQRPRYATCFEIDVEDYEGWSYRLKECGYATDKQYTQKLIKIIEDYHLDTLVHGVAVGEFNPNAQRDILYEEPTAQQVVQKQSADTLAPAVPADSVPTDTMAAQPKKRPLKATVVHRSDPIMIIHNDPEPEYVVPLTAIQERDSFYLSHPKKKFNGINYVVAREGDTYANVAFRLNVKERELREFNDALGRDLMVGDRIYLASKKMTGTKDYVMTYPGLSFWKLCQEEGVMMEAIQKLNGIDPTIRTFRTRQKLYLRKVKDDGVR